MLSEPSDDRVRELADHFRRNGAAPGTVMVSTTAHSRDTAAALDELLRLRRIVKMLACQHPADRRVGGNDYLACQLCGLEWDYRKGPAEMSMALRRQAIAAVVQEPPHA